MNSPRKFAVSATVFELGLGVVALAVGALLRFDPLATLPSTSDVSSIVSGILIGLAATAPMLVALYVIGERPGVLEDVKELVQEQLVPHFSRLTIFEIALISVAAGIGEEILFRGLIQNGLAAWIGPPLGLAAALILASLAFGCSHWLSSTYAAVGTLVGMYLGALLIVSDQLLAPMVTHAVYDFVAIIYLVRKRPPQSRRPAGPTDEETGETGDD